MCEKFNVYTNPLKNPQRNPNVNPNRREPLTEMEIQSIVIAHRQYSKLGAWNLSLFLSNEFNVHVCTMGIRRVLYPEKYKCKKIIEKIKFFEKPRSHVMYHADTMEVVFNNGSLVYQISIEDDYSRGYVALCVFPMKHPYFVVLSMLQSFRLHSKPKLFHNPKGNGKKEKAHSQDRKFFYDKNQFQDIESVEKAIPEYLRFRNESKGQWAWYGQTASSAMKNAEAKPLTNEELEWVIRELYFDKDQRVIKPDGKFKFEGKWYHLSENLAGKTIEVRTTLKGIEVWYNGSFIKRWKYWEYILNNAVDYMLKKYLL